MGFRGNSLNKFDDAGRLSLPAKMREELRSGYNEESLVGYYISGIVKLMPRKLFEERMAEMEKAAKSNPNPDAYRYFRKLSSSSYVIEINSAGRMNISSELREDAGLGAECYIIGVGDSIELWNKDKWIADKESIDLSKAGNIENFTGFSDMLVV